MIPGSVNFTAYRGDEFAFAFQFKDTSGDPFDMSLLGDITMRVFLARNETEPLFEPNLTVNSSAVTGQFGADRTIAMRNRAYYYELKSEYLGRPVTLINGRIFTLDATDGEGVMDAISEVTIDLAAQTIEVTLGNSAAIALQAKADAEDARDKAQEWAINPEDVPVETDPDEFSALHWSAKSEAFAFNSSTSAASALSDANRAEADADRAESEADRAEAEADRAEADAILAQTERLLVQNAVDADATSQIALETVALLDLTKQEKGGAVLVRTTEPTVNPPTGFVELWLDGTTLKAKNANGTNTSL